MANKARSHTPEQRVLKAAMRWFRMWKKQSGGDGPKADCGWERADIGLYAACDALRRKK